MASLATAAPGGDGSRTAAALPPSPDAAAPSAKARRRASRLVVLPLLAIYGQAPLVLGSSVEVKIRVQG